VSGVQCLVVAIVQVGDLHVGLQFDADCIPMPRSRGSRMESGCGHAVLGKRS
jgi:hypothetical protein